MIDLSTAYTEATRNISNWRTRYESSIYPHKIVLNMMYRAYAMMFIWVRFQNDMLEKYDSQDDALMGMERLYGQVALNDVHQNLEHWLTIRPSTPVGNLIYTNFDAKATAAEFSASILEELEFSYIFDLLEEKLVLYWIALRLCGASTVDAIAKLTDVIVELGTEPSYADMKHIFQELIVKQFMNLHYSSSTSNQVKYDVVDDQNSVLGVSKVKHITEHEQHIIDVSRKKDDYSAFMNLLNAGGVEYFYHYTAKSNLESIKKLGGLYSWQYCREHGINVPFPGGTDQTHLLDERFGLLNYVRLSLCPDYPMAYVRKKQGVEVVVLKIRKDVALAQETLFSDINAIDEAHIHGGELRHLMNINIPAALSEYSTLTDLMKKQHDAEIMVKECVPIEYIVNIDNPDEF